MKNEVIGSWALERLSALTSKNQPKMSGLGGGTLRVCLFTRQTVI